MTATGFDPRVLHWLRDLAGTGRGLGVAVSGGGDSMALLVMLLGLEPRPTLYVATVDHGLRAASGAEADGVAAFCAARGIGHTTLRWDDWDQSGNLQDAARRARYRLMSDWARGLGIADVALGHTGDDNAETFLMGLARGAGLDGLSGMRRRFVRGGVTFHRPLLDTRRAALREVLRTANVGWVDDPSNDDPRFDRIKARRALTDMGIHTDQILKTVANLAATRAGIEAELAAWARTHVTLEAGDLLIGREAFAALSPEFRRRALNAALRFVSGGDYPPRAAQVAELMQGLDGLRTLHGCLIDPQATHLRIAREPAAVRETSADPGGIWDNRWRLAGPAALGCTLRALGETGLAACPDWRNTGLPRTTLLASPALWREAELVAAPLAGKALGWAVALAPGCDDFAASLLSH